MISLGPRWAGPCDTMPMAGPRVNLGQCPVAVAQQTVTSVDESQLRRGQWPWTTWFAGTRNWKDAVWFRARKHPQKPRKNFCFACGKAEISASQHFCCTDAPIVTRNWSKLKIQSETFWDFLWLQTSATSTSAISFYAAAETFCLQTWQCRNFMQIQPLQTFELSAAQFTVQVWSKHDWWHELASGNATMNSANCWFQLFSS